MLRLVSPRMSRWLVGYLHITWRTLMCGLVSFDVSQAGIADAINQAFRDGGNVESDDVLQLLAKNKVVTEVLGSGALPQRSV